MVNGWGKSEQVRIQAMRKYKPDIIAPCLFINHVC